MESNRLSSDWSSSKDDVEEWDAAVGVTSVRVTWRGGWIAPVVVSTIDQLRTDDDDETASFWKRRDETPHDENDIQLSRLSN